MNLRQFNGNDISLISKWLTKPHVQKYFGEPNEWLTEIQENINLDWIKYFIVEMDEPIGFAQYYETDKAPQGIWSDQPPLTVGIDYLIGSENYQLTWTVHAATSFPADRSLLPKKRVWWFGRNCVG